jgi:hypothetical protein
MGYALSGLIMYVPNRIKHKKLQEDEQIDDDVED